MTTLTVVLPDDEAQKLKMRAQRMGINLEAAARLAITDFNQKSEDQNVEADNVEFQKGAEELLRENAELYRRLA
jgi:plasmid stability protein